MGKSSPKAAKPGPLEKQQAAWLDQQRQDVVLPLQQGFMGSAYAPAMQAFNTSLTAPERQNIESQYNQAKADVMGRSMRGGLQQRMLGNLDQARAGTVSMAANQAKQQGIQRALGLLGPTAFPGAQAVQSGGMDLVKAERDRAAMGAQQSQAKGQGTAGTLGSLAQLGMMAYMMY